MPLNIGILAPPWIPLPPPSYGGIELVVTGLARELAGRGHAVTVLAAPGSELRGVRVVTALRQLPSTIGDSHAERAHVRAVANAFAGCDVVLDHSGLPGIVENSRWARPWAHVVHGPMTREMRALYRKAHWAIPDLELIAISNSQRYLAPELPWLHTCHNGMDLDGVVFEAASGDHLAFLGRMSPEKGVVHAIEIARQAGVPLKIAAKCREAAEIAYFERAVEPRLGGEIEWLGELGAAEKFELLRRSRALLFPIQWNEPFGLVMIEAMAAGTPVLATPRGSVPEVVRDGVTGHVSADIATLSRAAATLDDGMRPSCRAHVERNFSVGRMTDAYEHALHLLLTRPRGDRAGDRSVVVPADAA